MLAAAIMNGAEPSRAKAPSAPRRDGERPEHLSQALLEGARELSALFEKRVASIRADYEEKIRALMQERESLILGGGSAKHTQLAEAPDAFQQERESWQQDRAEWRRTQAQHASERESWEKERQSLLEERDKLRQEAEALRKAREGWQKERAILQQQLEQARLEHETKLEELTAATTATIEGLQLRVQWLEGGPEARLHSAIDQIQFNSLDIFQSPPRSATYAGMSSTLGTSTPIRSPSQDPMAMQVGTPPPMSFPFDVGSELDWLFAPDLHDQVDGPPPAQSPPKSPTLSLRGGPSPPRSPTVTARGGHSPPKSPTITLRGGQSPAASRTPAPFSVVRASQSSSEPKRLFIRVPPSTGKPRKPIKPPPSPPTEEERNLVVHVPPSQNASDGASPSKSSTTSSSGESSSDSLSSP
ncbi:hypothetical protein BV20DRAFT_970246 [Pilatotrama ljubarskyi]|nr:hypothetical protein BV20DRAFT_970246 [Pilatotrama ljubarskyi]